MTLLPGEQIHWGDNFENVISFDWPYALDAPRAWRRPVIGSERGRTAAGVTDAWITGRDYLLAGRARWFHLTTWSSSPGLQEFLDWAADGNAFRFVPDSAVPEFYVPDCYLELPFDDAAPELERDGSQSADLVIRNATFDFGLALRGLFFDYAPGGSLERLSIARASAATYRGKALPTLVGIGGSALVNALRDRHYEGTQRTTLLENDRTQLVAQPENFGDAAWVASGTPGLTSGQPDPFATNLAYSITDDDAGADESIRTVIAYTGDATKAFAVFMRAQNAAVSRFGIWDDTAGIWRHLVNVTWTGTVPTLSTGSGGGALFTPIHFGNNWYLLMANATGVVAANANRFYILPAGSGATGSTYVFGANTWNAVYPTSYQGPSIASRPFDDFSRVVSWPKQSLFVYAEIVRPVHADLSGTLDNRWPGVLTLGAQALEIYMGNSTREIRSEVRASPIVNVIQSMPVGALIKLCAQFRLTAGLMDTALDVGSGPGSFSSSTALNQAAWNSLLIGRSLSNSSILDGGLVRLKIGPRTFAGVTRDTVAKGGAV